MPVHTLADILFERAATDGDSPAVCHGETVLTYAELAGWVGSCADELAAAGVSPGDRVAIVLPNSLDALAWLFATACVGAVVVVANSTLKQRQLAHVVEHSGATVVCTGGGLRDLVDAATPPDVPILRRTPPSDEKPSVVVHAGGRIGSDLAALIYTSGSTGLPKGVMVSHANLVAGARIVAGYLRLTTTDRTLCVLPWSFDAGLNQVLATFWAGGTAVIAGSVFAPHLCRLLRSARITGLAGVPPLWELMVAPPSPLLTTPLPDLRYVTNTGGSLRQETVCQLRQAFPHVDVYLMYGLTEAFRSTYLPPELIDSRPGSIGRAIPETEILVLDGHDRPCPPGVVGELVHRGPTVSQGYWRDDDATRRVFRPYPFSPPGAVPEYVVRSGDYVRRDDDGFLYYVGRRDEQFKSRGFRVNPGEIESELLSSGIVSTAVVFPRFHDGESVITAAVVPAAVGFSLQALRDYCARTLPPHQQPAAIHVFDVLPTTTSGKVDRAAVAAIHHAGDRGPEDGSDGT